MKFYAPLLLVLLATLPASTNYQLHNYDYGSGGTTTSSSTNYKLDGGAGRLTQSPTSSTNYTIGSGNNNSQQSNVPPAPAFTNPANYYNKLKVVLNTGNNPTDTKFSLAISSDNFVTTKYVQNDGTIGPVRGLEDYQTYALWGSASGQIISGLTAATTYKIKVNAIQGSFTETQFGPTASAATANPTISFDIDVAAADIETSPPYVTAFSSLLAGSVVSATNKVWIDLDTNADNGAKVYISSTNTGLRSNSKNVTIASATADLSGATTGYGAQKSSATQSSGGPLAVGSTYNLAAQNVGIITTTLQTAFSSPTPITAGRGSLILMAKSSSSTPASNDYLDTLTLVAAASY